MSMGKKITCKICSTVIVGRSDKKFCSIRCKNYYHVNLRKVTHNATKVIDEILHRNRAILLEILGKKQQKITVPRLLLETKNFTFKYHTHTHINHKGKILYWVYDLGWMQFSNNNIVIFKNNPVQVFK